MSLNAGAHGNPCESCARLCDEAKEKVTRLEKRVYRLTIACTVAVTLLGQELAKAVAEYVSAFQKASGEHSKADGGTDAVTMIPNYSSPYFPVPWYYGQLPREYFGSGAAEVPALAETRPASAVSFQQLVLAPYAARPQDDPTTFDWKDVRLALRSNEARQVASDFRLMPESSTQLSFSGDHELYSSPGSFSGTYLPAPGPLLVLALGGMAGSRSR